MKHVLGTGFQKLIFIVPNKSVNTVNNRLGILELFETVPVCLPKCMTTHEGTVFLNFFGHAHVVVWAALFILLGWFCMSCLELMISPL